MRALTSVLATLQAFRRRIGVLFRKHPIISIALPCAVLAGVAFVILLQLKSNTIAPAIAELITQKPPQERRALDGVWVEKGKGLAHPSLVSVMIENARDAQPLSGVDEASLVYEALVESTITRLMAVIPMPDGKELSDSPIGPVRSVRPYYLTWTSELGAMLAHVGGSNAALAHIKAKALLTLNEYTNGSYFFRNPDRRAPHNVYTNTALLAQAAQEKLSGSLLMKWSETMPAWQFKDDAETANRGNVHVVTVGYAEPYTVRWEYSTDTNTYTRMQWGGPHTMSTNAVLTANNIVVVTQRMAILDEIGRKEFTTEGTGSAYLFRDGIAHAGTWRKDSPSGRMRIYDTAGTELELNAGKTWIHIVPTGTNITY